MTRLFQKTAQQPTLQDCYINDQNFYSGNETLPDHLTSALLGPDDPSRSISLMAGSLRSVMEFAVEKL